MNKPWEPYALHVLDAIAAVIDTHLPALEDCVRTMLEAAVE